MDEIMSFMYLALHQSMGKISTYRTVVSICTTWLHC